MLLLLKVHQKVNQFDALEASIQWLIWGGSDAAAQELKSINSPTLPEES